MYCMAKARFKMLYFVFKRFEIFLYRLLSIYTASRKLAFGSFASYLIKEGH